MQKRPSRIFQLFVFSFSVDPCTSPSSRPCRAISRTRKKRRKRIKIARVSLISSDKCILCNFSEHARHSRRNAVKQRPRRWHSGPAGRWWWLLDTSVERRRQAKSCWYDQCDSFRHKLIFAGTSPIPIDPNVRIHEASPSQQSAPALNNGGESTGGRSRTFLYAEIFM